MKKYVRVVGSVLLLALLAWRVDWEQMGQAFARLHLGLWFSAVCLYLFAQTVSVARWQLLAQVLGLSARWAQLCVWYFIGMFFNLVLPTAVGGDVVRAWYLGMHAKGMRSRDDSGMVLPVHQLAPTTIGPKLGAFLSVFTERVNGLSMLIAITCVATISSPMPLPGWIIGIVATAGTGCVVGLGMIPLLPRLRGYLTGNARVQRMVDASALYMRQPRTLLMATSLSLVVQWTNVLVVWLIGMALGLPVPLYYYAILVPLVTLLTMLPVSVNGMGLREAGTVLILGPLGVSVASAVTLSLLTFATFALASLVGAGFYLFGSVPRVPSRTQEGFSEDEDDSSDESTQMPETEMNRRAA